MPSKTWSCVAAGLAVIAFSSPVLAGGLENESDAWLSPLPAGSHVVPDKTGKLVACEPPRGEPAPADFRDRCATFLEAKKLYRAPVPSGQAEWVSQADLRGQDIPLTAATIIHLKIAPDGSVSGCDAKTDGAFAELDQHMCNLVSRRAKFSPGLDASGNPQTSDYYFPFKWHI